MELIRYWGIPNAVCGENKKLPPGFNNLYRTVTSKVDIPQKKFLDWPIGMEGSNNRISLSRTMLPDLVVSQPNLPPIITSDIPSPTRQLREPPLRIQPPVSNPGQNSNLAPSLEKLKEQRIKVATFIMNGNFGRLGSEAQEWKKRKEDCLRLGGAQEREVALAQNAEQFLNQYFSDNDEGMLQINLIQAYQTHLGIDILDQGVEGNQHQPSPQLSPPLQNSQRVI